MKITVLVGTLLMGLLFGANVFAMDEHGDHDRGPRNEHARSHEDHGRASRDNDHRDRGNRRDFREDRRDERPDVARGPERGHMREARFHDRDDYRRGDIWKINRAHDWRREHRDWRERGGYHGYRIPDERFHAYFGRGHWFRVHSVPVIVVEGRPRFQYAGFWFTMVEPWPETWAATWYQTDDVYVDYVNDGYYLCNRRHPGVMVAVNVSL